MHIFFIFLFFSNMWCSGLEQIELADTIIEKYKACINNKSLKAKSTYISLSEDPTFNEISENIKIINSSLHANVRCLFSRNTQEFNNNIYTYYSRNSHDIQEAVKYYSNPNNIDKENFNPILIEKNSDKVHYGFLDEYNDYKDLLKWLAKKDTTHNLKIRKSSCYKYSYLHSINTASLIFGCYQAIKENTLKKDKLQKQLLYRRAIKLFFEDYKKSAVTGILVISGSLLFTTVYGLKQLISFFRNYKKA